MFLSKNLIGLTVNVIQTILYLELVTSKNVKKSWSSTTPLEFWKYNEVSDCVTVLSWKVPTKPLSKKLFLLPMRNPSQTLRKSQKWPVSSNVYWVTLGLSFHLPADVFHVEWLWLVEAIWRGLTGVVLVPPRSYGTELR